MQRSVRAAVLLSIASIFACGKNKAAPTTDETSGGGLQTTANPSTANVVFDLTRDLRRCMLGHRGVLLDFGDASLAPAFGLRAEPNARETTEHEGATFIRFHERRVTLEFLSPMAIDPSEAGLVVEARARGGAARTMSIAINGKAATSLTLDKGKVGLTSGRAPGVALVEGQNEMTITFGGAGRGAQDSLADVDWFHIGPPSDESYSAPTRADALTNTAIGGVAKAAVSLRGPGFAACTLFVQEGSRFDGALGITKGGDADVELRLHRDRGATEVLQTWHLGAEDAVSWKHVNVAIPNTAAVAELEISVTRASKGARVLVGDARVLRDGSVDPPAATPRASGVVLIVIGDVSPRTLAAFGGRLALPELDALAKRGYVFDGHRSSTTLSSGALASMLTGMSPREHGVLDQSARLPANVTTIADAARQAGIDTALFTANPLTGRAFGFDRGFGTFVSHTPAEETAATQVFDEAAKFIDAKKDGRFLVVIHARGAHPPWDATSEDLKDIAPANYTGGLEPRHAAELMSKARRVPPVLRFQDADRERAWALADVALVGHDRALGRLLASLRSSGRDATTAIIVTSDLAADQGAHVPFGDPDTLDEQLLSVPLVMVPPGATLGKRLSPPTTSMDVAASVLASLGLEAPSQFRGMNLWPLANGAAAEEGRARLAVLGPRFAARIGPFVLTGSDARETRLCGLELEPTCTTDVRATHPIETQALRAFLFDSFAGAEKPPSREPAAIDADTLAALRVWGL